MMKLAIFFTVLVAVVLANPRVTRQLFKDQDPKKVPELMKNADFVKKNVECVIATEAEVPVKCDKNVGLALRDGIPAGIQKGDCPSACNDEEKKAIAHIFTTLQKDYPAEWEKLKNHFKPTPEQTEKLNAFIAAAPK